MPTQLRRLCSYKSLSATSLADHFTRWEQRLLAARQIQKASNSAKHVWTPITAQDPSFSASPSSEDDPACVAQNVSETLETVEMLRFASHEQVQQQTVEHVPQIIKETAETMRLASHEQVQQQTVEHVLQIFKPVAVNRSATFLFLALWIRNRSLQGRRHRTSWGFLQCRGTSSTNSIAPELARSGWSERSAETDLSKKGFSCTSSSSPIASFFQVLQFQEQGGWVCIEEGCGLRMCQSAHHGNCSLLINESGCDHPLRAGRCDCVRGGSTHCRHQFFSS